MSGAIQRLLRRVWFRTIDSPEQGFQPVLETTLTVLGDITTNPFDVLVGDRKRSV